MTLRGLDSLGTKNKVAMVNVGNVPNYTALMLGWLKQVEQAIYLPHETMQEIQMMSKSIKNDMAKAIKIVDGIVAMANAEVKKKLEPTVVLNGKGGNLIGRVKKIRGKWYADGIDRRGQYVVLGDKFKSKEEAEARIKTYADAIGR